MTEGMSPTLRAGTCLHGKMETDRISLHVNSWYGGTNAGWWEWERNYGKGKLLKKGDRIQETVRLRFAQLQRHIPALSSQP